MTEIIISGFRHGRVQFQGAISEAGQGIVHHLEVFHCQAPPHVKIQYYDGPCSSKSVRPKGLESCRKVLGAWAMGAKVFNPLPHGDANRHTIFKRKN